MDKVNSESFDFCCEVRPLIHRFLLLYPVVLINPETVQVCRPLGGKAIIGACIWNNIFGRYSSVFYLPIISLDLFFRDIDFERLDLVRHLAARSLTYYGRYIEM